LYKDSVETKEIEKDAIINPIFSPFFGKETTKPKPKMGHMDMKKYIYEGKKKRLLLKQFEINSKTSPPRQDTIQKNIVFFHGQLVLISGRMETKVQTIIAVNAIESSGG